MDEIRGQVRTIDQLDGARTNDDDRMMLLAQENNPYPR